MTTPEWSTVVAAVSTPVLVLITAYYAWQNKRMVEEMRRQNRPYVYILHEDDWLILKNGGTRSAHQIRLEITRDADVPKQYEMYAEVRVTKAGEPEEPSPPPPTKEQWEQITQGVTKVTALPVVSNPIPALVPGQDKKIARVTRHIGKKQPQRLDYIITYCEGGGLSYREELTAEYDI